MTRYVLHRPGGTITPADLPDKDVRDSYLAGDEGNPVRIVGSFRGYYMQNVSVAYAVVNGDWSNTQTRYLTSWNGDWSKAILPPDISPLKHDLVVGVLKRKLAEGQLSARDREAVVFAISYVAASSLNSWMDTEYHLINNLGMSVPELIRLLTMLFTDYPLLIKRMQLSLGKSHDAEVHMAFPPQQLLRVADERINLMADPRITGEDRWASERALERLGWRVHLFRLHPWPTGIAADTLILGEPRASWWDWWRPLYERSG